MSIFRKLIESTYPLRMKISKVTGMGRRIYNSDCGIRAPVSFYSLKAILNTGEEISFGRYKGKKVLIVNVASKCGYTPQYTTLEKIYKKDRIIILGFPSNDFGGQEPGTDPEIANFCTTNYGVTFPIFKKDSVKGITKQPVYEWLSDKNRNGWNEQEPQWNFYKYVIDENGNLQNVYSSAVSPSDIK